MRVVCGELALINGSKEQFLRAEFRYNYTNMKKIIDRTRTETAGPENIKQVYE